MSWTYADLFNVPIGAEDQPKLWTIEPCQIPVGRMGYRTRTVLAGPMLDIEVFPRYGRAEEDRLREAKQNSTQEKVQAANLERAKPDYDRVQKDLRNYRDRIRRRRQREGLPDLKYIYVVEGFEPGNEKRGHAHMVVNGGISRDELEKMWTKGVTRSRHLEPNDEGMVAVARYIMKEKRGGHRWACSKNLKRPDRKESDCKISNRRVKTIAEDELQETNRARRIMETLYPDYEMVNISVRGNDIVPGVYIRSTMRRKPGSMQKKKGKKGKT